MERKGDKITWKSGAALVVANMIGTGVFTSLGLQLQAVENTWSIVLLWAIGGMVALSGAYSYAELGAYFKRSGGEYHYLSEIFHPVLGYLSGWVSLTVGFSAPIALAAMALAAYTSELTNLHQGVIAIAVVLIISIVHSFNLRQSSRFQNITTIIKLLLIIFFIISGLILTPVETGLDWSAGWQEELIAPAFAVSLVYVTYSYTGWNAAAYIVEEIKAPSVNLPKALIRGTGLVIFLYILLQLVFLRHAPLEALKGKLEIGHIAAVKLFGATGGNVISVAVAIFLISSISAMVWVGPRITMALSEDYTWWRILAAKNKNGIPVRAIWLQAILSIAMILTGSFEKVLLYCGFTLQLFSALSVFGIFILRRRGDYKGNFKSPGYPYMQLIFLGISLWILVYLLIDKPLESFLGLSNLLLGWLSYKIVTRKEFNPVIKEEEKASPSKME